MIRDGGADGADNPRQSLCRRGPSPAQVTNP